MAKRKRLSPANALGLSVNPSEDMSAAVNGGTGMRRRAPIADVVGDTASQAAFEEVSGELHKARAEGRLVLSVPLDAVQAGHLVRDRVVLDSEDMAVLQDSLRHRGQQTPIEVVDLGRGTYGLISGWRRLTALRFLLEETGDPRFSEVRALVRAPESAAEAYRAMVEENEVRSDLSFFERAHIACKAVEEGVYPDVQAAVQGLFAASRAPKRSKIVAFTTLVSVLGDALAFPAAISEKVGLSLVAALKADPGFALRLKTALGDMPQRSQAKERAIIDAALRAGTLKSSAPDPAQVARGILLTLHKDRIVLSGHSVDASLAEALKDWLSKR